MGKGTVIVVGVENVEQDGVPGVLMAAVSGPLPDETLPFLQEMVGGYVDVVRSINDKVDVWVADELRGDEPVNMVASVLTGREIRGSVVIADCDPMGETIGLDPINLAAVQTLVELIAGAAATAQEHVNDAMREATADVIAGCEALIADTGDGDGPDAF